jgi:hypothetical protein
VSAPKSSRAEDRMDEKAEQRSSPRSDWVKQYVIGLVLGSLSALYGLYALVTRHAFLPNLVPGHSTLVGNSAMPLAAGYLSGGLYLVLRFFVHRRCRSEPARAQVYLAENALLMAFIAALVYLLLKVGSVGD